MGDYCIRCGKKKNINGDLCLDCKGSGGSPNASVGVFQSDTSFLDIVKMVLSTFFSNIFYWIMIVIFTMLINLFPVLGQLINFFVFSYFKKSFCLTSIKNRLLEKRTEFSDVFLAGDTVVLYIPLAVIKAVLSILIFIIPKIVLLPVMAAGQGLLSSGTDALLMLYVVFVLFGTITLVVKLLIDMIINFAAYFIFDKRYDAFKAISESVSLLFDNFTPLSYYFLKVSLIMLPIYLFLFAPLMVIVVPIVRSIIDTLRNLSSTGSNAAGDLAHGIDMSIFNEFASTNFFIFLFAAIIYFIVISNIAGIISNYFWSVAYLKFHDRNVR